jgi:hypothetical protein
MPTVPSARRRMVCALLFFVVAITVVVLGSVDLHGLDALKAAGLIGTAPGTGAEAFKGLIETLQQNAIWLMATGIGFGFTLLALMFFLGSIRAPDYLLKIGGAVAIILVVGPGVVS